MATPATGELPAEGRTRPYPTMGELGTPGVVQDTLPRLEIVNVRSLAASSSVPTCSRTLLPRRRAKCLRDWIAASNCSLVQGPGSPFGRGHNLFLSSSAAARICSYLRS